MKRKVSVLFSTILVLGLLAAIAIVFVPFVNIDGNLKQKVGAYIVGAVFWTCVLGQIILSFICKKFLLQMEPKKYCFRKIYNGRCSLIVFGTNKEAKIADISLFILAALILLMIWMRINVSWIIIVVVAMFILALEMHCVLNGKNYQCIKYLQRYTKENEKDE